MKRRIRVRVGPGMFSNERYVSFDAGGKRYSLVVDQTDVQDNTLAVHVIEATPHEALVDLPRETLTTGARIRVPADILLPA